jgi:hypothetical protein
MRTNNPFEGLDPEEQGMAKLAAMTALIVEDCLNPALEGRGVQSCLHAVDQATGIVVGQEKTTDRMGLLCTRHPDRLICDQPGDSVWPGCLYSHLDSDHRDELPARCFVCEAPIEGALLTPVFAKIVLHQPLKVYADWKSSYVYLGGLRTMPVTYLCPTHSRLFDVHNPWVIHWPVPTTDDLAPEDIIGG